MPLFSIITVSYNSEKTIAETIESLLNQTIYDFEYFIIDGLSTDNTVEIARGYKEQFDSKGILYKIISEEDNGIYDAMNKGIANVEGDIVGIINSDDYYNLDTLEKVRDFYNTQGFDILYGNLRVFNDKKEFMKKSKYTKKFDTRFWNHPTTFVTKHVYNELQYACESMYDDLDFMLRARSSGKDIKILNEVLANFRLGGVSNGKSWKGRRESIKLRNNIYKKHNQKGYRLNNWLIETAKFFLS